MLRHTYVKRISSEQKDFYLASSRSRRPGDHRSVGNLDRQVLIVNQWPGSLNFTGLKVVVERAKVWISEKATVGVVGLCGVTW